MARPKLRDDAFDRAAFLRDVWQQRPLVIRDAWADWINPIDPDDLAGLACEDGVEARLIEQTRSTLRVEHGPLATKRVERLGKRPWTLLVQAVDHHASDVAALIEPFRFIPDWRIDDVMVSYAADGGGVGAHFDQYDVFLIQGSGRRRWQVGQRCDETTMLLPHDDLRLVADFVATDEWVLEAGDILYVPPRVAHHGVAVGEGCMTYSIGFRAPSRGELIAGWCDHLLAAASDDDRYEDRSLPLQGNSGQLSDAAIAKLYAMMIEGVADPDGFARWFGRYNSTPKYPEIDWAPDEPVSAAGLRDRLDCGERLCRNPASRFSFIRRDDAQVLLFVDGECFDCADETASFAERLCASDATTLDRRCGSAGTLDLIATLCNQGSIALDELE